MKRDSAQMTALVLGLAALCFALFGCGQPRANIVPSIAPTLGAEGLIGIDYARGGVSDPLGIAVNSQ